MLFTCSLRCTRSGYQHTLEHKTFTLQQQSEAKVRFILRHLFIILHSHQISAKKKQNQKKASLHVCEFNRHSSSQGKKRGGVSHKALQPSKKNMAPRNAAAAVASGGFTAEDCLMSYRWLLCAMTRPSLSTFMPHHGTHTTHKSPTQSPLSTRLHAGGSLICTHDWRSGWNRAWHNSFQGNVATCCMQVTTLCHCICIFTESTWSFAYCDDLRAWLPWACAPCSFSKRVLRCFYLRGRLCYECVLWCLIVYVGNVFFGGGFRVYFLELH